MVTTVRLRFENPHEVCHINGMSMNLANWLTLLRLCLVPLVIVAISQHRFDLALFGFVTAGLTDALDGYVARRFDQITELGALLDPIADKALLMSIFISLGVLNLLPAWLVILVVARDVMIMGAVIVSWLLDNPVEIKPLMVSKANTFAQIVFASYKLLALGYGVDLPMVEVGLLVAVCLFTTTSITAYLIGWLKHMSD